MQAALLGLTLFIVLLALQIRIVPDEETMMAEGFSILLTSVLAGILLGVALCL